MLKKNSTNLFEMLGQRVSLRSLKVNVPKTQFTE
jgi:hypothetical protein